MHVAFVLIAFALGLKIGSLSTIAVERLLLDSPFRSAYFGYEDEEPEFHWWTYVPFALLFIRKPPFDVLRWYERLPLISDLYYMWRLANFQLLVPRSHCRSCKGRLKGPEQIPILSWIRTGGRCPHCRVKIPFRYNLVEIASGLAIALLAHRFGCSWMFVVMSVMAILFVVTCATDWRAYIIPDEVNTMGYLAGILICLTTPILLDVGLLDNAVFTGSLKNYSLTYAQMNPQHGALGFLAGMAPLYLFGCFAALWARTEAMGGGDIKLAGWIGLFLGWQGVLMSLGASVFIAFPPMVFMKVLDLGRKEGGYTKFAYGPYICFGAAVVMYMSPQVVTEAVSQAIIHSFGYDRYLMHDGYTY